MLYILVSFVLISFRAFVRISAEANWAYICSFSFQMHYPQKPDFDFHKYMIRAVEHEFKRVVGIRLVYSEKGSMFP
jgi:mlo protein